MTRETKSALLTAFPLTVIYLFTRTASFSYDSLTNALAIEFGWGLYRFNPSHLLASVPSMLLFSLARWLHPELRALTLVQFLNASYAGVALFLFHRLIRPFCDGWTATLGTVVLGLLYSFWDQATDPGVYPLAVVVGLLVLRHVLDHKPSALGLGLLLGLAVAVHQMYVFLIPLAVVTLWTASRHRLFRESVRFSVGFVLTGIVPYLVILAMNDSLSVASFRDWQFGALYHRPHQKFVEGAFLSLNTVANVGALLRGFVASAVDRSRSWLNWAWAVAMAVFVLGPFVLRRKMPEERADRRQIWLLITWVVVMNVPIFFWDTGDGRRFRLLFFPAFILLILRLWRSVSRRTIHVVLAALAIVLAMANAPGFLRNARAASNLSLQRALWVRRELSPSDFLLFAGMENSITNVDVAYFSYPVHGRSLYGYLFGNLGNGLAGLDAVIRKGLSPGGHLYCERELYNPATQKQLENYGQLPPGSLAAWLTRFPVEGEVNDGNGYALLRVGDLAVTAPSPTSGSQSRHR